MLKIIIYTGILSSSFILVSVIVSIVISFLLAIIKAVAHLAFEYPKKYAFYASVVLATVIVGGYTSYSPSILSTINEKIAESAVLSNIVFSIAILVYFVAILSAVQIVKGMLRGE